MKNQVQVAFAYIFVLLFFVSCNDISQQLEDKVTTLTEKTAMLDSLVNKEIDKVTSLDSLINKEHQKVKKLDSLIHNSTEHLDSVVNKVLKP